MKKTDQKNPGLHRSDHTLPVGQEEFNIQGQLAGGLLVWPGTLLFSLLLLSCPPQPDFTPALTVRIVHRTTHQNCLKPRRRSVNTVE